MYDIIPEQPKEKAWKAQICYIFLILEWFCNSQMASQNIIFSDAIYKINDRVTFYIL